MQDLLTVTLTLAGLFFSLMCALLLEELLFGVFFRLMASHRGLWRAPAPKPRPHLQRGGASNGTPQEFGRAVEFGRKAEVPQGGVVCSH